MLKKQHTLSSRYAAKKNVTGYLLTPYYFFCRCAARAAVERTGPRAFVTVAVEGAVEVEAPKLGAGTGATFDRAAVEAGALIFFGVARRLIVSADTSLEVFLDVAPAVDADAAGVDPEDVLSAVTFAESEAVLRLAPTAPDPEREVLLPIA